MYAFGPTEIVILILIIALIAIPIIVRSRRKSAKPAEPSTTQETSPTPTPAVRPPSLSGAKLFISYRRTDSADVSGRIYDRLVEHFGRQAVFKDVDDIPLGADFRQHIHEMIQECNHVLVVIGRGWVDAKHPDHSLRLHDPRDFVRIEIEAALEKNIPIIPLLVGGAHMPVDVQLPDSIKELAFRNGIAIRPDPDFHHDMDRLIAGLE
jgi:hypothetical protein